MRDAGDARAAQRLRLFELALVLDLPSRLAHRAFETSSLTVGYLHELSPVGAVLPALGVLGTLDVIVRDLGQVYGTRLPIGGLFCLRLRPAGMHAGHAPSG